MTARYATGLVTALSVAGETVIAHAVVHVGALKGDNLVTLGTEVVAAEPPMGKRRTAPVAGPTVGYAHYPVQDVGRSPHTGRTVTRLTRGIIEPHMRSGRRPDLARAVAAQAAKLGQNIVRDGGSLPRSALLMAFQAGAIADAHVRSTERFGLARAMAAHAVLSTLSGVRNLGRRAEADGLMALLARARPNRHMRWGNWPGLARAVAGHAIAHVLGKVGHLGRRSERRGLMARLART